MRRFGLSISIAGSLVVAAIIASCSGDSSPISTPDGGTPGLSSADLQGGGWSPSVESAANNEGKVTVCHSGNGKNFSQITVSPQGARAHLGDPSTGKGGHSADYRVSALTPCPPSANAGGVSVCKVAGTGVNTGTNFTFTLTANGTPKTVTVAAGAAPNGTCVSAGSYPVGTTVAISEGAQTGVNTSAIAVSPAGAQQGTSDLTNRSATFVTSTGSTTITYTNTTTAPGSTGTLVVCKVAGTGVTVGTNFFFNVGATGLSVAAGAAPNGTCYSPISVPAGPLNVSETGGAGTVATAITGTPTPTNVNLGSRSATIAITAGQQATITFTNTAATAANSGTLVVCKVAGTGVTAGTNYSFTVGGQTVTVAAGAAPNGTCSSPVTLAAGTLTVNEASQTGVSVSAIAGTPSPTNVNLAGGSADIAITAGQQSTITFTNTTASASNGTLVVCKVAGTGVTAGTNFFVQVGAAQVGVVAGAAPNGTCNSPISVPAGALNVSEIGSAGTVATAIAGTPNPTNVNLAGRSATIQITAGQQATITFTNTASTAVNSGTLVICKIAGTGVTSGTTFTFSVGGLTANVAAGAAPNGTCGSPITLGVGSVTVTENAVTGTSVSAITGTPTAPTNVNLAGRSATVAITAGQETRITYTNIAP
jgi:hypothetical protein